MSETIVERVAAGAALLDQRAPGWAERIDLEVLALEDCYACVLGQLFHWFDTGLEALAVSETAAGGLGFSVVSHSVDEVGAEFAALTAAWRELIAARQKGARDG